MGSSPRIDLLIVDGDAEFRDLLLRRFERAGFAAQGAPSGEIALQLSQQQHFAAAIFEMQLSGVTALELLAEFKANDPDCAVIFLTGYDSIAAAVQVMQAGAIQYLLKPCSLAEVEGHIREAIECCSLRHLKCSAIDGDSPGREVIEESAPLPAA